ncbi:MAG: hypothetical protein H7178_06750 [Chitinophagaceae bacterium]|nr:hypothetical protein [Chitinophagaceae bacterium]
MKKKEIIAASVILAVFTGSLIAYFVIRKKKKSQNEVQDNIGQPKKLRKHVIDVFHNAKNHLHETMPEADFA